MHIHIHIYTNCAEIVCLHLHYDVPKGERFSDMREDAELEERDTEGAPWKHEDACVLGDGKCE